MWIENMLNKIYLWDCLDLMKQIPDKSIDLVLTDPPYWIGAWKENEHNWRKDYWYNTRDESKPSKEYFDEIFRISKNQIIRWWNYFTNYLPPKMCWLVWDKWQRDFLLQIENSHEPASIKLYVSAPYQEEKHCKIENNTLHKSR